MGKREFEGPGGRNAAPAASHQNIVFAVFALAVCPAVLSGRVALAVQFQAAGVLAVALGGRD
jgi:hypothetical protein